MRIEATDQKLDMPKFKTIGEMGDWIVKKQKENGLWYEDKYKPNIKDKYELNLDEKFGKSQKKKHLNHI